MTRLKPPFGNWVKNGIEWLRDAEGRKTIWLAVAYEENGKYLATVVKKGYLLPIERRKRFSWLPGDAPLPNPDKKWEIVACATLEECLLNVEKYLTTRTSPSTWRGAMSQENQTVLDLAKEVKPNV